MKNSLHVHVVLDSSGSMLRNKAVTLTALNNYIKALDDGTVVTVDRFATVPVRIFEGLPKDKAFVAPEKYPCEGNTALYDAIGHAVAAIDEKAKDFDRIALVVQTDGAENCSREFTLEAIRQILRDKQEGEGWLIIYLGAGLQAQRQFLDMGATAANTANYNTFQTESAFQGVTRATQAYSLSTSRSAGRAQASFTDAERKKMG